MIKSLAKSRIKYNKSRTLLTAIAIMLTTTLLMGLGTSAAGILDLNRQQAAAAGNVHATFKGITGEQLEILRNHAEVEAIETAEIFAEIDYGKMNGFLTFTQEIKSGIYHGVGNLIEGRYAEEANEICGPKAFFERLGADPSCGSTVTISFRPNGEGMIRTREFVICGLVSERDTSKMNVSDTRIAYGASVSEKLIDEFIPRSERRYNASVRVSGEDSLNYEEILEKIESVAADIGCSENEVNLNREYLFAMTDPGSEMAGTVLGIALLIMIFSGLVIYSIYYVGVITDVQEIGKLKALGASLKQIKKLLLIEGMIVSCFAIPPGLVLGFLIPHFALPAVAKMIETMPMAYPVESIDMFSAPVLAAVSAASLLTVCISLARPAHMAAKVSPVEAIRYRESSGRKKTRKGYMSVNTFRLMSANLTRNKRRTAVTMITMGLSCVLFMSLAGTLNSMSAEDIARRNIRYGDFRLELESSNNDRDYPENNINYLQTLDIFSEEFVSEIENIKGVEKVERYRESLIGSDYPSEMFDDGARRRIAAVTREEAQAYSDEIKRGEIDYDRLIEENGVIFTSDTFFEEYRLEMDKPFEVTIFDGEREIPLSIKIMASIDGADATFLMPRETFSKLDLNYDNTGELYIYADSENFDSVKAALGAIADSNERFILYSMDEELEIGEMSINTMKLPMYAVLVMIAVIGFMNLINTMVTSIVTRKRELGVLQAVGLSGKQLVRMLAGEGMVFIAGTITASVTLGNIFGYLIFLWAKKSHLMSISAYHYPIWETVGLVLALVLGQLFITFFIGARLKKESIIDRIRGNE